MASIIIDDDPRSHLKPSDEDLEDLPDGLVLLEDVDTKYAAVNKADEEDRTY